MQLFLFGGLLLICASKLVLISGSRCSFLSLAIVVQFWISTKTHLCSKDIDHMFSWIFCYLELFHVSCRYGICDLFRVSNVVHFFLTLNMFHVQGILSALVLSIIPLIRPYHWQSFLMPVMAQRYVTRFIMLIHHDL